MGIRTVWRPSFWVEENEIHLLFFGTSSIGCMARRPVASTRDGHWLDRPFPSDELIKEDGFVI